MSITSAASDEVQDPNNLAELAALERMIRRSDGFRIAFAVANHPALQDRLIRAVRRDLPDLMIAELTVPGASTGIVAEVETAARPPPDALFVFGLDELGSDQARSRVIAELNLNRDHLWRAVPVPVVLWASDFAIRQFAAQATDLWSGRSGVYRFRVEGDDSASMIADVISAINWGSTPDERREREERLHDLLEESGDDAQARVRLLVALGDAASAQRRYDEAREHYEQALLLHRDMGNRLGEANTLRSLGDTALAHNRYNEAREHYEQALPLYRDLGDQLGEASTLRSLGDTALAHNRYYEADEQDLPGQRRIERRERRLEESGPAPRPVAAAGRGCAGIGVFLSYASQDLPMAREVRRWLVEAGHEVFLGQDLRDGSAAGEGWEQQLYERLRWADAVVCMVTSTYLTSVWTTAEVAIAGSLGTRLLPVLAEPGVVHPLLSAVPHIDMTRDPMEARAGLTEALRRIEAAAGSGWPDDRSPFPGLRPFDVDQSQVFFGRADEVGQLAGLLRSPALRAEGAALLVVGPSGCGKSSLVRAGLLPVMASEPGWRVLPPIMPGADPIAALTRELAAAGRQVGLDWTAVHVRQQLDDRGLTGLVDELLLADPAGPQRYLLVVVDEFEELLTQTTPAQRARFVELLRPALAGPVQLVATLRPEFLDQLLVDPDLAALPTSTYTLRPLRREALRSIIEKPARLAGIDVDEHLVAQLVADTDSGEALPLLAFTLAQLADGVGRGGRLSGTRYEQLGGVQGALIRQADAALAEATVATGRRRKEVLAGLLRLVTVDEQGRPTRWRVSRDGLPEPVTRELDVFIARRLLTTDTDHGTVVVGVAHEAILSAWPPLAQAIEENASALRARRAIEQAAAEWKTEGRPPARLWERGQLAAALTDTDTQLHAGDLVTGRVALDPTAQDFLRTSIRRDRLRRRRAITVLSVLLILALAAAGFAVVQQRAAQEQQRIATARELVAQATAAQHTDLRTALQLSIAAQRIYPSGETQASLVSLLTTTPYEGTLIGHTGPVTSVAFSPDGRALATASDDHTVRLWNLTNPAQSRQLGSLTGHTGPVTSVVFAPDGRTLATASADHTVRLWDLAQHRQLSSLTGHTDPVTSVAFAPDGHTLATASTDQTVRLWDVSDPAHPGPLGSPLTGHTDAVNGVAFAPDGHTLATASADQTVRLWDLTDRDQPHPLGPPLTGHTGPVNGVAFAPDGRTLASASADQTVILWNLSDPARPRRLGQPLTGHTGPVNGVAFAPDGHTLATASADQTVRLWDVSDRDRPRQLGQPLTGAAGAVNRVAFAPDGRTLAAASRDGTAILWDLASPGQPRRFCSQPRQLCSLTGHTDSVTSVAFSPEGRTLITGSRDGTAILQNLTDPIHPITLATLVGHAGPMLGLAFSPDGRTLATAGADQTVILWNLSDPARPRRLGQPLTGHTDVVTSVAFSPDGHTLATGSDDRTVRLWDVSDPAHPRPLGSLTGHARAVTGVAFAPDGRTLATTDTDQTVRLWDVSDRDRPHLLGSLTGHTDSVNGVAFAPDGRTLATTSVDRTVRLWNVSDRDRPHPLGQPLAGHTGAVFGVAFAPDGRTLATTSADHTVRLWDLRDRDRPHPLGQPLTGHTDSVTSVAFAPDGHILATGSADRTTILWDLTGLNYLLGHVMERACAVTGGGLDGDEWARYIPGLPYQKSCPA